MQPCMTDSPIIRGQPQLVPIRDRYSTYPLASVTAPRDNRVDSGHRWTNRLSGRPGAARRRPRLNLDLSTRSFFLRLYDGYDVVCPKPPARNCYLPAKIRQGRARARAELQDFAFRPPSGLAINPQASPRMPDRHGAQSHSRAHARHLITRGARPTTEGGSIRTSP